MKFLNLEGLKIFTQKIKEELALKVSKEELQKGFTWGELKKKEEVVQEDEGDN